MAVSGTNMTIDQIYAKQDKSKQEIAQRKVGEMGKDQFLTLLITQLRYQDPMNPVNDKEFVGQMAQFSSLEQMQNIGQSFATMRANSYLGKNIKAAYVDENTKQNTSVSGLVSNIVLDGDKVLAKVNGTLIPVEKISEVSNGTEVLKVDNDLAKYTGYIGFKVKSTINDGESNLTINGIVDEIIKSDTGAKALIGGVELTASEVAVDREFTDPNEKEEYLKNMLGKEVTIITDGDEKNTKVKVTGILKDYVANDDSTTKVILDNIELSVDDISGVKHPAL